MGEARRRGSFEERKDEAIKEGHSKEEIVRRIRLNSRRAGKATAYKEMLMALMLVGRRSV